MLRAASTTLLLLLGCVLLPVCFIAALALPRRDGQRWQPQPPAR